MGPVLQLWAMIDFCVLIATFSHAMIQIDKWSRTGCFLITIFVFSLPLFLFLFSDFLAALVAAFTCSLL